MGRGIRNKNASINRYDFYNRMTKITVYYDEDHNVSYEYSMHNRSINMNTHVYLPGFKF